MRKMNQWFCMLCSLLLISVNNYLCDAKNISPIKQGSAENNATKEATNKLSFAIRASPRPYQIQLFNNNRFTCSGSIVHIRFVLTAAHCLHNHHPRWIKIVAGTSIRYDLRSYDENSGEVYGAENLFVHPYFPYNPRSEYASDVGLVKVDRDFRLSDDIAIIWVGAVPPANTVVDLAGWGDTEYPRVQVKYLRETKMRILDQGTCTASRNWPDLDDRFLCTRPYYQYSVACNGDSGGPLVWDGRIIGLVSFGDAGCPALSRPDVFTRITTYFDWINTVIQRNKS